jgi:hypothetical protein
VAVILNYGEVIRGEVCNRNKSENKTSGKVAVPCRLCIFDHSRLCPYEDERRREKERRATEGEE